MKALFNYIKSIAQYLLIIWVIIILVFSSLPSLPVINIDVRLLEFHFDKIMHFSEYFALAFLSLLTFAKTEVRIMTKKVILLTLCLLVFAAADESHQLLIAARSFSIYDMLADFIGIVLGIIFTLRLNRM